MDRWQLIIFFLYSKGYCSSSIEIVPARSLWQSRTLYSGTEGPAVTLQQYGHIGIYKCVKIRWFLFLFDNTLLSSLSDMLIHHLYFFLSNDVSSDTIFFITPWAMMCWNSLIVIVHGSSCHDFDTLQTYITSSLVKMLPSFSRGELWLVTSLAWFGILLNIMFIWTIAKTKERRALADSSIIIAIVMATLAGLQLFTRFIFETESVLSPLWLSTIAGMLLIIDVWIMW